MSSNHPDQLFWATRWTVIDVVALAITAVVLGAVFYLWGWAMQGLNSILGEVIAGLFYGVWFWAGLLLAYAIRKPGAALLGEFGAALVAFALGSPLGILMLVLGWVQGLALEVVFAWERFRHWGVVTMVVAGAVAGTASFAVNLVAPPAQVPFYSAGVVIAVLCLAIISGAVLGGLVCKLLGDRLLAIPAVRQFLGTPLAAEG
jgi:energy-coupling factor transport system substrate-specific component